MNGDAIADMVNGVTKTWCKKKKAEERACRAPRVYYYSNRVTLKDAAAEVIPDAYLKASGGGRLPANARQVMYAARGPILAMTGNDTLDSQYFTQTLLPDFIRDYPEVTSDWKIAYDARGTFKEPHVRSNDVRLGTLEVEEHLLKVGGHECQPLDLQLNDDGHSYPTCGPANRYSAILFIEKEGFWPLLEASGIAKKYDLAMISTKGESNVASRTIIDALCGGHDLPLFVVHDFDVAGINIRSVLGRDNRRYEWENEVNLVDLGIRLSDVEACGLESEPVKLGKNYRGQLRRNGATAEEAEYLLSGRRVELNAFTSDQFIEWLEGKLNQHGVKKVVPKREVLVDAYLRAAQAKFIEDRIAGLEAESLEFAQGLKLPSALTTRVRDALKESPASAWDAAIYDIVSAEVDR